MLKRCLLALLLALPLLTAFAGCLKIGSSTDNRSQFEANAGNTGIRVN